MAYRRNRRSWRRGERDTFPLRVAAGLAGMLILLLASLVWAAFGDGTNESVTVAVPGATDSTGESLVPQTEASDLRAAAGIETPAEPLAAATQPGAADAGEATPATQSGPVETPSRSVVMPVAARASVPARPRAPGDTTAAGHAGLAEALLAAGDTVGAMAAYNAFLARNADPDRERAIIAKLREIGAAWRSGRRQSN